MEINFFYGKKRIKKPSDIFDGNQTSFSEKWVLASSKAKTAVRLKWKDI